MCKSQFDFFDFHFRILGWNPEIYLEAFQETGCPSRDIGNVAQWRVEDVTTVFSKMWLDCTIVTNNLAAGDEFKGSSRRCCGESTTNLTDTCGPGKLNCTLVTRFPGVFIRKCF